MDPQTFFDPPDKTASFDNTNWFTVRQAGSVASSQTDAARARLCQSYWYPIYFYIRRLGHGAEDAQDLTQEFFARIFHKNYLQSADSDKGKFRSFLLTMLKHFMADEWDWAHRQKRGGGAEILSLDAQDTEFRYRTEPADESTPEKAFERRWAASVLEHALERLKDEYLAAGKARLFEELKPFLMCDSEISCAEAAQKLELTESNVKVTVHRLRHRCRELVRAEIAGIGASPAQIEEEIRDLFAALA